jgi:hypothetical protein
MRQYLFLRFSGSPTLNPQKMGTSPGSVRADWKNDHKRKNAKKWNTARTGIAT